MNDKKEVWYFFSKNDGERIASVCNFGMPTSFSDMEKLIKLFEDKYIYVPESEAPSWVLNVAKVFKEESFEKIIGDIVKQLKLPKEYLNLK